MAREACAAYGYKLSDRLETEFLYRTTHNDGVFRVYTEKMKLARKCGIITGLPDAYGRGRIIGDYRRVALYGVDKLIECKKKDKEIIGELNMDEENIKLSEELYSQINFLEKLKEMALLYGIDISKPAATAKEAVQWLYFGYLAAIKEQNGAAMSLGRTCSFLDIYIERDIKKGVLTESAAQELIDDFVIKLRLARHLRTPEYNELFAGDPMWITECVGGMGLVNGDTLSGALATAAVLTSNVGDYAITQVTEGPAFPNLALRKHGYFKTRNVNGMAYPDIPASRAFAMCDHEIAHVYVNDSDDFGFLKFLFERERAYETMVSAAYERGGAINMAAYGEIDDVIDPADSRRWVSQLFAPGSAEWWARPGKRRPAVDAW